MTGRPRDVGSRVVSPVDEPVQEVAGDQGDATPHAEPRTDRSSLLRKLAALALAAVVLGLMVAFFLYDDDRSAPLEGAPAPPRRRSPEEADPPRAPPVSGPVPAVPERSAPGAATKPPTDAPGPGTATGGQATGAAPSPEAPRVRLVTLGYSATPRLRIAALMINGGLPVMLHEGESDRGIEVSAILSDRVYFRYAGHTYVANLKD